MLAWARSLSISVLTGNICKDVPEQLHCNLGRDVRAQQAVLRPSADMHMPQRIGPLLAIHLQLLCFLLLLLHLQLPVRLLWPDHALRSFWCVS